MKLTKNIPFKKKTKYVLERKINGSRAFVYGAGDKVEITPEKAGDNFNERVFSTICDKDFVIEGYSTKNIFYANDVLVYDGENLEQEEWPERYKILKNNFDWKTNIKLSKPLVVTNREEMNEAFEIFTQIPNSEGVIIREYNSRYNDKKYYIPEEKLNDEKTKKSEEMK